jgi:hypothetical protein
MASTIATLLVEVESRLNLTNAGAEPSDNQISDFLRLAFKELIGVLHPVQHTTLTLGNTHTAALTHDRLFFVSRDGLPLYPWEFTTSGANVKVASTAANRGDTIEVWYFAAPTITTGSTTTVETSCIFGDDWLEELAVLRAMMPVCDRLSSLSPSNSGPDYLVMKRTIGEDYDRIFNQHKATWYQWFSMKNMELQARQMNGPDPVRYSGHVGFRNSSRVFNWLTGAGDEGVPN